MTLKQSSAVHIQALVSADGILPGFCWLTSPLVINLASVPGGQLVNSPTAQSLDRWLQTNGHPNNHELTGMKTSIFLFLIIAVLSCKHSNPNPYDQSNYMLVRTDSFEGQYFINKNDTSRKLRIEYWDNGILLAKGYTHQGKRDGEFIMYDQNGNLMRIDSFIDGKKIFEKQFYKKDTSVKLFKDGKIEEFKSIDSLKK